jgi:hypothetical protein
MFNNLSFFIYCLCNDTVDSSDCIVLDGRMTHDWSSELEGIRKETVLA